MVKKKSKGDPDPSEYFVDLHIPPKLYKKIKALNDKDHDLFVQSMRSIFPRDEIYGVRMLRIYEGTAEAPKGKAGPKKTCDITMPTP